MRRYDIPDPKCRHAKWAGRVVAGWADGPHASTWVCARQVCIDDAIEWATAKTGLPARFISKEQP